MISSNDNGETMKQYLKNLPKGIVVGVGGITPGLSGSVLLVIFGLYQQTIDSLGNLFKNTKKNLMFLIPLLSGFILGVFAFSKVADFLLEHFEMQTRFAFLGLVLGTIPLFYRQVKQKGFSRKYYIHILLAAGVGTVAFLLNGSAFPQVEDPNLFQSVLLGVAVAGSSIVPGVDSAVILSSLGLYELYVSTLADLDWQVLLPGIVGLVIGGLGISALMSRLIKRFYTGTFSVVFGLFLAMIPNVLSDAWRGIGWNGATAVSFVLALLGFCLSFYLSDVEKNNSRLLRLFGRKKGKKANE